MRTAFIMIGFSGSGKSTYAREYAKTHTRVKIVSPDAFRTMFTGDYEYNEDLDDVITESCFDTAENLLQAGYDVIIDCGNITNSEDRRAKWKKLHADRFIGVLMPTHKPVSWYVKRRRRNPHRKGADLELIVESEMRALDYPTEEEFHKLIKVKV